MELKVVSIFALKLKGECLQGQKNSLQIILGIFINQITVTVEFCWRLKRV